MGVKLIDFLLLIEEGEYVCIKGDGKKIVSRDATPYCPASWLERNVKSVSTSGDWNLVIEVE